MADDHCKAAAARHGGGKVTMSGIIPGGAVGGQDEQALVVDVAAPNTSVSLKAMRRGIDRG
jgi:hypothetical protein